MMFCKRSIWAPAVALALLPALAQGGTFAPAAGQPGSHAIAATSPLVDAWATGFVDLVRGPQNASVLGSPLASFGAGANTLGAADATAANPAPIVSLGDGGHITLTFARPIVNRFGPDLAVFENSFGDTFLELAFVEVSTNGVDFVRFAATSLTPTAAQVGAFTAIDPTDLDNLAGKYRAGFGTPFDLEELIGASPALDVNDVHFVRVVDVVGSITPGVGTLDSHGNPVNDPFPTAFASGGFDLDAVAVLHEAPEPSSLVLAVIGAAGVCACRRRWTRWASLAR
ncbi:MAG: PEP-CTERM sorting domain-containing protein [Pirellulales bacterium]|nr:PEP-CTERM sorting domain-containing protein [Pirellulales bacterium]